MEQNNPSYHPSRNDLNFQRSNLAGFKINFNPPEVVQVVNIPLNNNNFIHQLSSKTSIPYDDMFSSNVPTSFRQHFGPTNEEQTPPLNTNNNSSFNANSQSKSHIPGFKILVIPDFENLNMNNTSYTYLKNITNNPQTQFQQQNFR
ncbi:12949_t:CDS:2 [Funneliformis mosseae]|uniref:12949_t:CDS:1 n=1 Tax=Funneliformis mosseae TaxID=27381 RepID=A0A9N9BUM1_FUNMO|nr:12949_t:CDS:2 [Funneliformis mosseae]